MKLDERTEKIINLSTLMSQKYNILVSHKLGTNIPKNTDESIIEFLNNIATVYNCIVGPVSILKEVNLQVLLGQIQLLSTVDDSIKNAKPLVSNHHFVSDLTKTLASYLNFIEVLNPGDVGEMVNIEVENVCSINDIQTKYEVKLKEFNIITAPMTTITNTNCLGMYEWFNTVMFRNLYNSTKIYDEMDRKICRMVYETTNIDSLRYILDMKIKENKAYQIKLAYRNNLITMETAIKFSETINDIVRNLCALDRFIESDIDVPVTTKLAYQKIKNIKLTRPARRAILDKIEELSQKNLQLVKNDFFENKAVMKLIASKVHPYENFHKYEMSIRNVWDELIHGKLVNEYTSSIEKYIKESNLSEVLNIIRDTDLVRRLNKLVDICKDTTQVKLLCDKLDNSDSTLKNYIQAYQCLMSRYNSYMRKEKQIQMTSIFKSDRDNFMFRELDIPKDITSINDVCIILKKKIGLKSELIIGEGMPELLESIDETLSSGSVDKFKLHIDESLNDKTLPMGNRFKSISFEHNSRFSREVTNQTKIRAFTHWIGNDLDLHCLLLNSECKVIKNVSFSDKTLYVNDDKAVMHSGDVRHAPAPMGANEYVDIDIDLLRLT
ncbi:MAG: hypothetical protein ACRCXT_08060, partial [Paraclostridium sp.]